MSTTSTRASGRDQDLLESARGGSEDAFAALVEPHRRELHAHCYRMLGSVHDAEDALQDALLRAWRGLARFEGRSSLRSWLYTIATNACLDQVARRPKRALPVDHGPAADPHLPPGEPLVESVWIEPYPDELLGIEDGLAAPHAHYERREAVELAFIAALQHLPGTQRAVLIQREVLGFSAKEVADSLQTTVASVNSALQRARATVHERVPEQSQQSTLRALGEDSVRELVDRYVDAWERNDVEAFVAMLAEDATFAMPPLASWYGGREAIRTWANAAALSGAWRWRVVRTSANGQPALGFYAWNAEDQGYRPFALNVLSFRAARISNVTAFIARSAQPREREEFLRYPEEPVDVAKVDAVFARFGLPTQLQDAPSASARTAGLQNFRDVGGLATAGGGSIRRGVLYRSDAPRAGDPPPRGVAWPPAIVVDLRSVEEARGEHALIGAGSEVHAIPLMAEAGIVRLAEAPPELDAGVAGLYRRTLASVGPAFAEVACLIGAAHGPTLVHCTAGKDRTGLVIAVLLAAAGVDREDIIADYARTQANMPGVLERIASTPGLEDGEALVQRVAQVQPEILTAPADAIAAALDVIQESGGAEAWLRQHGLSDDELAQLRARLVE
jgi:RNA polymerase sigma-70 factor (ECF subfamily)